MRSLLVALLLASGCAPVRPWERETLSRRELRDPPCPSTRRHGEHVYRVREGTHGAYAAGGGGCGCN